MDVGKGDFCTSKISQPEISKNQNDFINFHSTEGQADNYCKHDNFCKLCLGSQPAL